MSLKISVIVTSFDQRAYLVEALDSVLAQTLPPLEIIVVDDASRDGSREVIAEYARRHADLVRPIYHAENQGVARARNAGLRAARGEHATYLDGDDRFLPEKLEREGTLLEHHPEAQLVFSDHYYIDARGARTGVWADGQAPPQGDIFQDVFARRFPKRTLFRNELVAQGAWRAAGFYDPQLELYEDWDMRIRLTRRCRAVYCAQPLKEYRLHAAGLSRAAPGQHLAAVDYICRKNEHLLAGLSGAARAKIERSLREWVAQFGRQMAPSPQQSAAKVT